MPWYRIPATIILEIEAENDDAARDKANTILSKRVEGQQFGWEKNDQGSVLHGMSELSDDWEKEEDEEYTAPECDICGGQFEDVIDGICGECAKDGEIGICDACGERAARGEERPADECECECHIQDEEE